MRSRVRSPRARARTRETRERDEGADTNEGAGTNADAGPGSDSDEGLSTLLSTLRTGGSISDSGMCVRAFHVLLACTESYTRHSQTCVWD